MRLVVMLWLLLGLLLGVTDAIKAPGTLGKFGSGHGGPILAIDDDREERRDILSSLKDAKHLNEVTSVAFLVYAGVKVITHIVRLKWPTFLVRRNAVGSAAALQKEQEELWHIVDKIYRGHEERLMEQRNATVEVGKQTQEMLSGLRETSDEMESVKMAFSQLSDRMLALESNLGKLSKASSQSSMGSKALEEFKTEVAAKLRNLEAAKTGGKPTVSREDLKALEQKLVAMQAREKTVAAAMSSEQAKLSANVQGIRADLPKVLKQHDEAVAARLKAYGQELKELLATATATTAPGAASKAKNAPTPTPKPKPKPKPKPRTQPKQPNRGRR